MMNPSPEWSARATTEADRQQDTTRSKALREIHLAVAEHAKLIAIPRSLRTFDEQLALDNVREYLNRCADHAS